jgi:hypothetical protein
MYLLPYYFQFFLLLDLLYTFLYIFLTFSLSFFRMISSVTSPPPPPHYTTQENCQSLGILFLIATEGWPEVGCGSCNVVLEVLVAEHGIVRNQGEHDDVERHDDVHEAEHGQQHPPGRRPPRPSWWIQIYYYTGKRRNGSRSDPRKKVLPLLR